MKIIVISGLEVGDLWLVRGGVGGGGLGEFYKFRAVVVHVRQNTCVHSITRLTIFYLDLYFSFSFFFFVFYDINFP